MCKFWKILQNNKNKINFKNGVLKRFMICLKEKHDLFELKEFFCKN